jgi:hypothetical protein
MSSYKFVPIRIRLSFNKKQKKKVFVKHRTRIRKKRKTTWKPFSSSTQQPSTTVIMGVTSRRRHSLFLILSRNPTIFFSLVCCWKRKTRIITLPWILHFRPPLSHLQPSSGLKATNCSLQQHYSNTKVINKKHIQFRVLELRLLLLLLYYYCYYYYY